jgi:hypothetical protein
MWVFCSFENRNREKTVGTGRRSIRSFPHPHFDKPIPDPTEVPPGNKNSTQVSRKFFYKNYMEL